MTQFSYKEFTTRNIGFVTESEQASLKSSKIFVAGTGGMGGAAIACLARMGVGEFIFADLDEFEVTPNLLLSQSSTMRLPMRWIAILKDNIKADFAATSGIHTGTDVVKMLLVGANVTMLCSSLLKHGINHVKNIEEHFNCHFCRVR